MDDPIECPRCAGKGFLTPANTTVGDMVSKHRALSGMTQLELAMKVGISRAQVANIENGRGDPPVSRLRAFADALNCQIKDLIP